MVDSVAKDPRLLELELLARADRAGEQDILVPPLLDVRERQMLVHLLLESVIHDPSSEVARSGAPALHMKEEFEGVNYLQRMTRAVHASQQKEVRVRIGHNGRLRIAELRDQLRFARRLEKHGVIWDGVHWKTDVGAALTTASKQAPVTLVIFDANGMKPLNDKYGHLAGDEFLRAYFGTIKATFSAVGEVYCFGGDEVGVICPATPLSRALEVARDTLSALAKTKVTFRDALIANGITSAAGVATTDNPTISVSEFIELADLEEKRAKDKSKESLSRPSVLAQPGQPAEEIH